VQSSLECFNVFGLTDVKEYQVVKYLDPVKERKSLSGQKKINSYKLLFVMDHRRVSTFQLMSV
jgi:hypothetical protein